MSMRCWAAELQVQVQSITLHGPVRSRPTQPTGMGTNEILVRAYEYKI